MIWLRRWTGPWLGVHHQYRRRPLALQTTLRSSSGPSIAIVTPSYNQGHLLERTLQSVLGQGYAALEYVVQDGGSQDESPAILERYRPHLHHCESRKDDGQAHALNLGFRHTTAEIMAYLNSDDLLLPGALAYVGRYFAAHPQVDAIYGHRVVIDEDDGEIGRWILPPHEDRSILWNDYVPQETLFWRRRIWEAAGGRFDESFHYALDWDLLLRFHAAGAHFARVPRFLGAFRIHPKQKTSAELTRLGLPEMDRLRQRSHGRRVSSWEVRWRVLPFLCKHVIFQRLHQIGMLKYGA